MLVGIHGDYVGKGSTEGFAESPKHCVFIFRA